MSSKLLRTLGIGAIGLVLLGVAVADAKAGRSALSVGRKALSIFTPKRKPAVMTSKPLVSSMVTRNIVAVTPVRVPYIPPTRSPYQPPNRGPVATFVLGRR